MKRPRRNRCTIPYPTKRGAGLRRARRLLRPRLGPDERDEGARGPFSDVEPSIRAPRGDDEDLSVGGGTNRRHNPTVRVELAGPCVRDPRRPRRGHDAVIRSPVGKAEAPIANDHRHVRETGGGQIRTSPFREGGLPLNRNDVARSDEGREQGRVIPRARPDLEDSFPGPELGFLQHDRNHRGGGNRLAGSDGERNVLVPGRPVLRTYEGLTGYREERGADRR